MKKKIFILCLSFLFIFSFASLALAKELYRIQIANQPDGEIKISYNQGSEWQTIGRVVKNSSEVSNAGFAASAYGEPGAVVATAVNAIHVKIRQEGDNPVLFSILPQEMSSPLLRPDSYFSDNSSIFTDIPAGTGIFGGGQSPFVGNLIYLGAEPLPHDYQPRSGDVLTIVVERPEKRAAQIIIENKKDGRVLLKELNGQVTQIAVVEQPVQGTGRFGGTHYADVGRIRANHPGVICISTSPEGEIGGFQIVPSYHASKLGYTVGAQWLVVSSYLTKDLIEGKEPLFGHYIQPVYNRDNWRNNYLVDVQINGGEWQPMPTITGLTFDTLKDVTALRILFPLTDSKGE